MRGETAISLLSMPQGDERDNIPLLSHHSDRDETSNTESVNFPRAPSSRRARQRHGICICGALLAVSSVTAVYASSPQRVKQMLSAPWTPDFSTFEGSLATLGAWQKHATFTSDVEGLRFETLAAQSDGMVFATAAKSKASPALEPVSPGQIREDNLFDEGGLDVNPTDEYLPDDRISGMPLDAATTEELDRLVCGRSPCFFLVAARTNEQETKAQQHLGQLAVLAKRLERILVLPNVSGGRYAVCRKHPFDYYHDVRRFIQLFDVPVLLWKDFIAFSKKRQELDATLTAQLIITSHEHTNGHRHTYGAASAAFTPERLCATQARLNFSAYTHTILSPAIHSLSDDTHRVAYGDWLAVTIDSPEFLRDLMPLDHAPADTSVRPKPDVLHMWWGSSRSVFFSPSSSSSSSSSSRLDDHITLPFHPRWTRLADRLADKFSPYTALHWRQEAFTSGVPDFVQCAEWAEEQVDRMNSSAVYFMTDFPLEGEKHYHSDSYAKYLRAHPAYRRAAKAGIDHLMRYFAPPSNYTWAMLYTQHLRIRQHDGTEVEINDLDTGLNGIIDKMVAERAERYLVGEPFVCGRHSSYALQIVVERTKAARETNTRVQAPVDYFPKDGRNRFEKDIAQ